MIRYCEIYPAPQGEGPTTGTPSLFVRLSGCNLHCGWCDSFFTWNFEGTKFKNEPFAFPKVNRHNETHEATVSEFHDLVRDTAIKANVKNIVITGGEPLIQQKAWTTALLPLHAEGFTFEIETNGTILPDAVTMVFDPRINCSPKLANSGNELFLRLKLDVLRTLSLKSKVVFKFVVQNESDMAEIDDIVEQAHIAPSKVYLMPEGQTKESQIQGFVSTEHYAAKRGYKVCPRVHILIHGTKRAV